MSGDMTSKSKDETTELSGEQLDAVSGGWPNMSDYAGWQTAKSNQSTQETSTESISLNYVK